MERKYKVLIVEDEMLVRIGMNSLIDWEEMGLLPIGDAENGEKGLEYFRSRDEAPDIVFTDINMPIMDGLEMMQAVRNMGYTNCVFIILTVLEDFEYARKALQLGALDYIPKLEMSKEVLHEVLDKAKSAIREENQKRNQDGSNSENAISLSRIMQGFLQFHLYNYREFEVLLEKQGYLFGKEHFVCAAARVLDPMENRGSENDNLIDVALLNTLNDMLGAAERGCVYVGEANIYHFILFFDEADNGQVRQLFAKIQNIVFMYFNCRLQFGFSEWGTNLEDLPFYLEQSRNMLEIISFWNLGDSLYYGADIRDKLIRCYRKEFRQMALGEQPADEIWMDELNPQDMEEQKRLLMKMEYHMFQKILAQQEIPFSAEEQAALLTEAGLRKNSCRITDVFSARLSKKIDSWKQEKAEKNELYRAMEYMKEHYRENITVGHIADAAGYSSSYLSNIFKKETGKSVMEYLNWYRVEKAKQLIREEGLRSYEVAELVGFADPNYFSRIFKKYTGRSTNEYRRNQGKDK